MSPGARSPILFASVVIFLLAGCLMQRPVSETTPPSESAPPPRALDPAPQAAQADAPEGSWRGRDNWRRLHAGMSEVEVRHILGAPERKVVNPYFTYWYYGYPSGGKVEYDGTGGRVTGWEEPDEQLSAPSTAHEPQVSLGPSAQFQENALKLRLGMPLNDVEALLGKPSETSVGTFGAATSKPWAGLQWDYRFAGRRFGVIYQDAGGGNWVVNSWKWWDF